MRYRGYYYEADLELYYLKTRFYNPETGRFISQDNLQYLQPDVINGLNLFAYCGNNPIMRIDPDGNAWWNPKSWNWKAIGKVVAAVAVVAVVTAVVATTVAAGGIAIVGAATATVKAATAGAVLGGIVAGGSEIIVQAQTNGLEKINVAAVGIETFKGSTSGAATALLSTSTATSVQVGARVANVVTSGWTAVMHAENDGLTRHETIVSVSKKMGASAAIEITSGIFGRTSKGFYGFGEIKLFTTLLGNSVFRHHKKDLLDFLGF